MNLYQLNRGVMCMAFNNCWLMSPAGAEDDVDRALDVFRECCVVLTA